MSTVTMEAPITISKNQRYYALHRDERRAKRNEAYAKQPDVIAKREEREKKKAAKELEKIAKREEKEKLRLQIHELAIATRAEWARNPAPTSDPPASGQN